MFTKKCTQLKPRELKQLCKTEWICSKCSDRYDSACSDTESENGNDFDIFEFHNSNLICVHIVILSLC